MTTVFALASSLLWGLADFGGGALTRRLPALTVVLVSQTAAAAVLGAVVVFQGGWHEAGPSLWYAVAAGAIGPAAMLLFYRALALGPMGVVSPLATVAVAVPLAVGLLQGERPAPAQYLGITVAVAGVVLAGGPHLRGAPVQRQAIVYTLAAAAGFGAVMALISKVAADVPGLFLALFVQRLCNIAVGGAALAVAARRGAPVRPADGETSIGRLLPSLALVGLADVAANGCYVLAARHGPVAVAAVLASLYPVVTALAARGLAGERLRAMQAAGAGLALVGSILLATG